MNMNLLFLKRSNLLKNRSYLGKSHENVDEYELNKKKIENFLNQVWLEVGGRNPKINTTL